MVPAFTFLLGMDQKAAVATSMAVIAPTALLAISKFAGAGLVHWQIAVPVMIGSILTTYFATDWLKDLSNQTLTKIFAIAMISIGVLMLFRKDG